MNLNLAWITHRENFISNRHHYMLIDMQISDPAVFDRSVKVEPLWKNSLIFIQQGFTGLPGNSNISEAN